MRARMMIGVVAGVLMMLGGCAESKTHEYAFDVSPTVGMLAGDPHLAGTDHVTGVAAIALVKDPGALRKRARNRDLSDALELGRLEPRQQRHASEQLSGGCLFLTQGC